MTNAKQQVVWRAEYTPFGKTKDLQAVALVTANANTNTPNRQGFGLISSAQANTTQNRHTHQSNFEFNLRFSGQYADSETGYHYNWHRYYDPETGRYLTPDPIGLQGGLNGYAYTNHDPAMSVDPWGLFVSMTFDTATGLLGVFDLDYDKTKPIVVVDDPSKYVEGNKNQMLIISNVFTGENRYEGVEASPYNIPIPKGIYDVLDNLGSATPEHRSWYRLDRQDSIPFNDTDDTGELNSEGKPRNAFRLHLGQNSWGCVTIDSSERNKHAAAMWDVLVKMMNATKTDKVDDVGWNIFSRDINRFGSLTVK